MTQIVTKFIQNNAVTGAKFRLNNNETLRARNAAGAADIDLFKLTTSDIWEFQRHPQASSALAIPSQPKEYATIEYITNYIAGKSDPKDAVNLLADVNVPLSGATPLSIDSATVTDGMRVALTNQTTGTQNGVYVASITGGTYNLTRATDFDQVDDAGGLEVTSGAYFKVISGTGYSGWEAVVSNSDPITIGTTVLSFVLNPTVQALTAGDMLKKIGNDFSVDLATLSGLESTSPGSAAGQLRVKVDVAALEKDQTTRRDSTTGAVMAKSSKKAAFTLTGTDITNGYVDLPDVAAQSSVQFWVAGGGVQAETDDYTVNYTGGTGGKTRVTFAGGLATGGVSELVNGDKLVISYMSW